MKLFEGVLHKKKVVVDASLLNEGVLPSGDDFIKDGGEFVREKLGEDLGEAVDHTNWPVVRNARGVRFLWNKDDVGGVYQSSTAAPKVREVD